MPRQKTFLVVSRGKPCDKSKRICLPNTLRNSMPVLNSCLMAPLSKISCKRYRYWYSGCLLVCSIRDVRGLHLLKNSCDRSVVLIGIAPCFTVFLLGWACEHGEQQLRDFHLRA